MEPIPTKHRQAAFARSPGYQHLQAAGLCGKGLSPWKIYFPDQCINFEPRLKTEYTKPRMVALAHRRDRGEVACFDIHDTTDRVYVYEYTEAEKPYKPSDIYESCFAWWKAALEETIESVIEFGEHLGKSDRLDVTLNPTAEDKSAGVNRTDDADPETLQAYSSAEVPAWLNTVSAPGGYRALVEDELLGIDWSPWRFLQGRGLLDASMGLQVTHPSTKFVVFAEHTGRADLACWDAGQTDNQIYVVHNWTRRDHPLEVSTYPHMFHWLRSVTDTFIAHRA